MWVMTSWGILMPGLRPAGTIEPGDTRTLQVRARRKSDLQTLRDRYMPDTLGPIIRLAHTDYEYRAYCTPDAWGDALAAIGRDIDYVKFKETSESRYGDKVLHQLYVRIWSVIFSALSTPTHQKDYWQGVTPQQSIKGQSRKNWWDEIDDTGELTESQLFYSSVGLADKDVPPLDEKALDELFEREGLYSDGDVIRRRDGSIDHSFCDHPRGRKQRRNCRRQHPRGATVAQ